MGAVQDIAATAGTHVVMVDNAIWLLCAKSGLYLSNPELADMAAGTDPREDRQQNLSAR